VRRALALGFAVVALVVATANPVWAHSGVNADASLHSVLDAAPPGLSVIVAPDGSGITLTTREDVVVLGYAGEPFLRFAGSSVADNANSLTSYQAANGMLGSIPLSAGHGPVRWRTIASAGTASYAWPDGRIVWSGSALPAAVMAAPKQPHDVSRWSIPVLVGGVRGAITGRVVWVPPTESVGLTVGVCLGVLALLLVVATLVAFPSWWRPARRRSS
jgi:hypothetical protein